jgi:hypothetical protein
MIRVKQLKILALAVVAAFAFSVLGAAAATAALNPASPGFAETGHGAVAASVLATCAIVAVWLTNHRTVKVHSSHRQVDSDNDPEQGKTFTNSHMKLRLV